MNDLVITDSHLDEHLEVYRLTVGVEAVVDAPMLDEAGEPVLEEGGEVLRGDDGEPVLDASGEQVQLPGAPVLEAQRVLVPVEDFVFSAYDERWKGKSAEEIVTEQRRLVRAALRAREREATEQRLVKEMPGVGEPL